MLIAQASQLSRKLSESWFELLWPMLAVVVALGILVGLTLTIKSWFHDGEGPAESPHEMLLQYRDLHRQGDLSEEEYRSIKQQLTEKQALPDQKNMNTGD